jgi:hypothetical protein
MAAIFTMLCKRTAGIAEIDKMVARIRTLAKQLQDGLAM